jgi:Uma2 family endonuclease
MPEPDMYWVDSKHRRGRPTAAVVPLVVEVSISSLDFDHTVKQRLYASEGIAEYWIFDAINQRAIVHLNPDGDRYLSVHTFGTEHSISPRCLPEAKLDLRWLFIE